MSATEVRIMADRVDVDAGHFREAAKRVDNGSVVKLFTGPFLEGMPYITDEFDDWRLSQAAWFEAQVVASIRSLVAAALDTENFREAARLAQRALRVDPGSGYFAQVRIEALALAGDVSNAVREVEVFRKQYATSHGGAQWPVADELLSRLGRVDVASAERVRGWTGPKLVGREGVLDSLREHWSQAAVGSRVALISGEAGIGKSRILRYIARRAAIGAGRTFYYECCAAESRLPYSGIVGLLRDGFRTADVHTLDDRWKFALAELAPELNLEAPRHYAESERVLWEAVAQYFELLTKSAPVVIALDDYQQADERTRELLVYITKRLSERPIFIVCAGRGHIEAPIFEDDKTKVLILDLLPLTSEQVAEFVADYASKNAVALPDNTADTLYKRIGGRPFLLLQALRDMSESPPLGTGEPHSILLTSGNVASHLRSRLAKLSAPAKKLAAAAAVVNREVPLHLLAKAVELSALTAAEAAAELTSEGVWSNDGFVRFSHEIWHDAANEALSAAERSLWHLRIAEALYGSNAGPISEIARHYENGGAPAKAYELACRAAHEAMRLYAYGDAANEYDRMLRCAPSTARDEAAAEYTRFALTSASFNRIVPHLDDFERRFRRLQLHEGLLACSLARLHTMELGGASQPEALSEHARRIVATAEEHCPARIAAVLWQVGEHLRRSGDMLILGKFAESLVDRARVAHHDGAADMLSMAALLAAASNGYECALHIADEAVVCAELLECPVILSRARFSRGTVKLWAGYVASAEKDLIGALGAVDAFAPDGFLESINANYSVVLMEHGRFDEARRHAQLALRDSRFSRRAYSFANLALISLRCQDYQGVERYVEALFDIHSKASHEWIPPYATAILGIAALDQGDVSRAMVGADAVEEYLGNAPNSAGDLTWLHLFLARVYEQRGNWIEGARWLEAAASSLITRDWTGGSRLLLERAWLLSRADRSDLVLDDVRHIISAAETRGAVALVNEGRRILYSH